MNMGMEHDSETVVNTHKSIRCHAKIL